MLSTRTDFPLTWQVTHIGPPRIIGTSGTDDQLTPPVYPVRAYYVRPETNQTYCLDELFKVFVNEGGFFPSAAKMKEVVEQLHPVDDLTLDELYMIFVWYEQMGWTSKYQHPYVLILRKDYYSNDIFGVIHVNGLIDYARHNGGVASLQDQPVDSPALPTWIGTVKYTPTYYTPPWAYTDIIFDINVFADWLKQYLVFS